jgi:hypothetical protein
VGGNTHSSCETIVVGWQVVEGLDVTPMDSDGGHSEVGVKGVDAEFVGGRPASLANLVSIAKGLGDRGVARVGDLDVGVGGRHEGSAGEAGSGCE